jgi:hypothetical protein
VQVVVAMGVVVIVIVIVAVRVTMSVMMVVIVVMGVALAFDGHVAACAAAGGAHDRILVSSLSCRCRVVCCRA